MLRTLANNVTFPNNFHLKLTSNPLECDCRLRWLRSGLTRLEYPIYHDEPRCEMPKALAEKKIVALRDEQFVCGPTISKPDLTVLTAATGEIATLRCDVSTDERRLQNSTELRFYVGLFRSCSRSVVDVSE